MKIAKSGKKLTQNIMLIIGIKLLNNPVLPKLKKMISSVAYPYANDPSSPIPIDKAVIISIYFCKIPWNFDVYFKVHLISVITPLTSNKKKITPKYSGKTDKLKGFSMVD